MSNPTEMRHLISAANAGDKQAQEEFFSKLSVRFSKLITRELRKYPMLANGVSLDKKEMEAGDTRLQKEVARIYHDAGMNEKAIKILAGILQEEPENKDILVLIEKYQEE